MYERRWTKPLQMLVCMLFPCNLLAVPLFSVTGIYSPELLMSVSRSLDRCIITSHNVVAIGPSTHQTLYENT